VQLGANVGHIQPLNLFKNNSKGVSIMDKFYLGGPTSLRGFQNKGIGPRERGILVFKLSLSFFIYCTFQFSIYQI